MDEQLALLPFSQGFYPILNCKPIGRWRNVSASVSISRILLVPAKPSPYFRRLPSDAQSFTLPRSRADGARVRRGLSDEQADDRAIRDVQRFAQPRETDG